MNVVKILGVAGLIVSLAFTTYKGDKDPLHKRKFVAEATEIKDGKPSSKKPAPDEIEFKNGKVYSSFVWDKMEFQDIKYAINKDSTFTDESGEELHYMEVEAITTNDKKETINMSFTINGYDIEGTYKLVKKEVVKKMFTTAGKEKVKAKKGK
jgi:hypothetical protein